MGMKQWRSDTETGKAKYSEKTTYLLTTWTGPESHSDLRGDRSQTGQYFSHVSKLQRS